jgi:sRNA-binding regulator protein Hfq
VNRKLIRTTLAEVKGREAQQPVRERAEAPAPPRSTAPRASSSSSAPRESSPAPSSAPSGPMGRKKIPPAETNAEIFYYKKQMDAHTQMVIILLDGEEVEGTIEWYDRTALKINRRGKPNIMLLKHNIKYMFKAEDRDGSDDSGE